jgi:integrase
MVTIAQLVALYETWTTSQVKIGAMESGTFFYYHYHHTHFSQLHGAKLAAEFKPYDLMIWGINWHRVQAVKRLFKWGLEAGILTTNPVAHVPKPALGQRNRVLDRREQLRALRGANPEFRAFLMCLRESMARPQEVRELIWPELVTHSSGLPYICRNEFKSRKRRKNPNVKRIIPITPRLERLLARLRRHCPTSMGRVFKNTQGEHWTGNAVRIAMAELRERVGLVGGDDQESVVCYTWRHTAITAATARGLRDRILADLTGHASTRTTARYQHVQAGDLLAAFHAIQ